MPTWYDVHFRIEPRRPVSDLGKGFAAVVADPVWFLGRQWQMGEHKGENAASPVRVDVEMTQTPIAPPADRAGIDPREIPAEAILEAEPDEWWTPGRRIRIGREAANALPSAFPVPVPPAAEFACVDLPVPYEGFNGRAYDGLKIFRARERFPALPASLFDEVPAAANHWDASQLVYRTSFGSGDVVLDVRRHDGGDVDWWSVDASTTMTSSTPIARRLMLPARFHYPGAPHPRWWQIENAQVDIGGYPPDRSHFPTMLLLDLILAHSDDWFTFPIAGELGTVLTLKRVVVTDAFGNEAEVKPPQEHAPPAPWSMFAVDNLGVRSLVLWPTAAAPLTGEPIEQVALGIDEDANALWGVEEIAAGRHVSATPPEGQRPASDPPDPSGYAYLPSSSVPERWHPYVIDTTRPQRWFVQGRLADYAAEPGPALRPEPLARLLYDDRARSNEPVHQIDPSAIPSQGLRLDRRWILARKNDGSPVLWIQRRRLSLAAPPISGLRFDVMDPQT